MPIQIYTEATDNTINQKEMEDEIIKQFNASPKYRLTNQDEGCLQLRLVFLRYRPSAISTDNGLAIAEYVNMVSLVWTTKPKGKHPFYIYHKATTFYNHKEAAIHIVEYTDQVVDMAYKYFPFVFE